MNEKIDESAGLQLQVASDSTSIPSEQLFSRWLVAALSGSGKEEAEVTIRIVDYAESAELNSRYRDKAGSTNVLSFPFESPDEVDLGLDWLGDLVICAPVVAKEAEQQGKLEQDHWAHMVVHGLLHLLGYDHIDDEEAVEMERLEIAILKKLGISDPYEEKSR